jgi:hypothetical protein
MDAGKLLTQDECHQRQPQENIRGKECEENVGVTDWMSGNIWVK